MPSFTRQPYGERFAVVADDTGRPVAIRDTEADAMQVVTVLNGAAATSPRALARAFRSTRYEG